MLSVFTEVMLFVLDRSSADQRLYIAQDQGTVRGYMVILPLVFDIQSKYKWK